MLVGRKTALLRLVACSFAFVFFAFSLYGCSKNNRSTDPVETSSSTSETIQIEVMKKISEKVLGDIPNANELAKVRERGVLRVALPGGVESKYISVDPEFGMPGGLFPALLSEVSNVLLLKLNMEVLPDEEYANLLNGEYYDKYDIYVVLDEMSTCPYETKVFYNKSDGWKSLCVATDKGEEISDALKEILNYMNKSGIFARIYERYAEK